MALDLRFVPITAWPGTPTRARNHTAFRASYADTLRKLEYELAKLKRKEHRLTGVLGEHQIRNDDGEGRPITPRHHCQLSKPWQPTFIPLTIAYLILDDNLGAIALSLEALRAVDR
jgi:hypothetical protein